MPSVSLTPLTTVNVVGPTGSLPPLPPFPPAPDEDDELVFPLPVVALVVGPAPAPLATDALVWLDDVALSETPRSRSSPEHAAVPSAAAVVHAMRRRA